MGKVTFEYRPPVSSTGTNIIEHWRFRQPAPREEPRTVTTTAATTATSTSTPTTTVPISALRPAESPRLEGQNQEHIARLAEIDGPLPPILVERRSMRVIDGTHRLMAAVLKGRETIEVEFFDGPAADTFLHAVKANVAHGYPLSQSDRQVAAARIVVSHPYLSDRAIAETVGLSAKTVARIRRRTEDEGRRTDTRVGRDGKTRPVDGGEGRRRVAELLAEFPEASIRKVARDAGVSPATASDVRKRLERGDQPTTDGPQKAAPDPRADSAASLAVLQRLLRDPALRHTDIGRSLLGLLRHSATESLHWSDLAAGVPPHCTGLVGQLAQNYAEMWSQFAQTMAERTVGKA